MRCARVTDKQFLLYRREATARQRNEQTDRSTINLDSIGKIYVTSFLVPFDNTQDPQITKSDFAQYSFYFAHLDAFSFSCSPTKGDKSSYFSLFFFLLFFLFGIIVCQILPFRHKITEDSISYWMLHVELHIKLWQNADGAILFHLLAQNSQEVKWFHKIANDLLFTFSSKCFLASMFMNG